MPIKVDQEPKQKRRVCLSPFQHCRAWRIGGQEHTTDRLCQKGEGIEGKRGSLDLQIGNIGTI